MNIASIPSGRVCNRTFVSTSLIFMALQLILWCLPYHFTRFVQWHLVTELLESVVELLILALEVVHIVVASGNFLVKIRLLGQERLNLRLSFVGSLRLRIIHLLELLVYLFSFSKRCFRSFSTGYLYRIFCFELLVVLLLLSKIFDSGGVEILQCGVFLLRCVGAFGLGIPLLLEKVICIVALLDFLVEIELELRELFKCLDEVGRLG